jgi:hypothetical protein
MPGDRVQRGREPVGQQRFEIHGRPIDGFGTGRSTTTVETTPRRIDPPGVDKHQRGRSETPRRRSMLNMAQAYKMVG